MNITLRPLAEQVVVVTGASSGIGLVTAREAARRGARVMLVARNAEALADAVTRIEADGGRAAFHVADVGEAVEVEAAAAATLQRFGRIDSWVNDAGVAIFAKLVDTPLDEHERLFRTNYFGVVNGCQAAIPRLASGGALITVGSIGSDLPSPILSAYAASKHAVKAYVEALRSELHADGVPIAVTLIKPSGIDTPIAQHATSHGNGAPTIPPPLYAPELIADAILHAAEHVTRDVTVGGVGRAQVLLGQHFPWALDWLAPAQMKVMFDKKRPATPQDNLFASPEGGRERSGEASPKPFSLYTAAALHPYLTAGVTVAAAAGAAALFTTLRARAKARAND